MNRHIVFVAGKKFVLLSDDSSEYVQKLAQEVNQSINSISEENPSLESRACALLCALDYADDMYREQRKNKRLSDKADEIIAQAEINVKKIVKLKNELEQKDIEIKNLQNQILQYMEKEKQDKIRENQQQKSVIPEKKNFNGKKNKKIAKNNNKGNDVSNNLQEEKDVAQISMFDNE